jgi:hypothetical protein
MKTDKSNYLTILTEELLNPDKGFLDGYLQPKIVARPLSMNLSVKAILGLPGLNEAEFVRSEGDSEEDTSDHPSF